MELYLIRSLSIKKSFYVMPWVVVQCVGKGRYKKVFDGNGNFIGWQTSAEYLADEVRLRCFFKVLEEELKRTTRVRVRVCD